MNKALISAVLAVTAASFTTSIATAADLGGGYVEHDTVVRERAPVVERERIIERRYYEPAYDDDVYVEAPYRRRVVIGYPYWGPRFHHWHRPYWHSRWGYGYGRW